MIKHLKKEDYKESILAMLVVGLFFNIVGIKDEQGIDDRLTLLLIPLAYVPFLLVGTYLKRRSHSKVLERGIFKKLRDELNLLKEVNNEFHGYKGKYGDYFLRLFWFPEYNKYPAVSFLIYYKRPVNLSGSLDFIRVKKINSEFRIQKSLLHREYFTSHVKMKLQGRYMRFKHVKKYLADTIESLELSNLSPVNEKRVQELIQEASFEHGPTIDTFQNNFKVL